MGNLAIKSLGGDAIVAEIPLETKPWHTVPHLRKLNLIILSLLMYSGTVGYDGSMMNGLQSLEQWQEFMNYPTGAWLGFINAIMTLGGFVTLPLQAWTADHFGRRCCLYFGLFSCILGTALQTAATNQAMFILARFFIGVSSAWFGISVVLITEIAYPSHRAKVTALFQCQYYVGSILAAWVTYGVRSMDNSWAWRIPSLLQVAPPLCALAGTILTPESPRWLVSKDRAEEALEVLARFHAGGDLNSPLVSFEMAEIEQSLTLEREAKNSSSYLDMLKTKGNRHRLFITVSLGIFSQWVGNGVVSYYLFLILDTVGVTSVTQQTLLNGFLNVWNLILAVSAALTIDMVGRRKLFLTSCVIMLGSYILITALSGSFADQGSKAVGIAVGNPFTLLARSSPSLYLLPSVQVVPFLFVFFGGYSIAFTPITTAYWTEIWPFALRARGVALGSMTIYSALLFNLFVNPIALAAIAWKYYIVFICVLIVAMITIYFTYPETRGFTLEEMVIVFDGNDAHVSEIAEGNEKERTNEGAKPLYAHEEKVA